MKKWLHAVCDKHGESIAFFISNPTCTASYLSEYDKEIQAWFEEHCMCDCRLISEDPQLDKLWDDGWKIDYGHKLHRLYKEIKV